LVPITNKVLIRPLADEAWSGLGIYLPEVVREKPKWRRGYVLAAWPKARQLFAGDEVLYDRYAVTELEVDGEILAMGPESDVIARVT
jgi:chaperonin GroES